MAEVMNVPRVHARGMLEWIGHPDLGCAVVPNSPIRLHGATRPPTASSPALGQHDEEVYGVWLGLSTGEIVTLRETGII